MTWEIFLGIVALVGFFITVGTPVIKLNSSIIRLNESVNVLRDAISKTELDNKDAHKRIWNHLDEIDASIKDHEDRLIKAEAVLESQREKLKRIEQETNDQEHRLTVMETEISQHSKEIQSNTSRLNQG